MEREIDWNTFGKLVFFGLRVVGRSRRRKEEEIRLDELEADESWERETTLLELCYRLDKG